MTRKFIEFAWQNGSLILISICLTSLIMPSFASALTVFRTTDDAISFAEMYPNVAFHKFGFNKVTHVSHDNTVSQISDTTNTVSADFTFVLDGTPYSGPGTWESIETEDFLEITLDHRLSSGGKVLEYSYTSISDFANAAKDETVTACFGTFSLSIIKHTQEIITETSKTMNMTGVVRFNGNEVNTSVSIVERVINSRVNQFTITSQSTLVDAKEPLTALVAEYYLSTNWDGSRSMAFFSRYDVTIGEVLTYSLDTGKGSTHEVLKRDENSVTEKLIMNLLHVPAGNTPVVYQTSGSCQVTVRSKQSDDRNGDGWSWNEFSKATIAMSATGADIGAATALATDGGAPAAGLAAASFAKAFGTAGGCAGYTTMKHWESLLADLSRQTAGQNDGEWSWRDFYLKMFLYACVLGVPYYILVSFGNPGRAFVTVARNALVAAIGAGFLGAIIYTFDNRYEYFRYLIEDQLMILFRQIYDSVVNW